MLIKKDSFKILFFKSEMSTKIYLFEKIIENILYFFASFS